MRGCTAPASQAAAVAAAPPMQCSAVQLPMARPGQSRAGGRTMAPLGCQNTRPPPQESLMLQAGGQASGASVLVSQPEHALATYIYTRV
jgi:hypothetical protein